MASDDVGQDAVEVVTSRRDDLRDSARATLGVTGEQAPDVRSFGEVLRGNGVGVYPLMALSLLLIVDQFHGFAFQILTPEISESLGFGKSAVAGILAAKTLAVAISPLPVAALVERTPRRALLAIIGAIVWAVATTGNAFVVTLAGLVIVLMLDGLTSGVTTALHVPLLMDSYPAEARVRAISFYQAAGKVGATLSPLLVAVLAGLLGFSWRGVFLVLGLVTSVGVLVSLRLRDPGFGRFDTARIRERVHAAHDESITIDEDIDVSLGFFEIARRLLMIPTIRRLMLGWAVFGVLLVPFRTFFVFFLDEKWNLGPGPRGVFVMIASLTSMVVIATASRPMERLFRGDPARVTRLASYALIVGVVLYALGSTSPVLWGMFVFFAAGDAIGSLVSPALDVTTFSILRPQMRPHAAALAGIFLGGVGGVAGAIFLGGIDRRFGIAGTMVAMLVPGILGALVFRSAGKLVGRDLDRMIDEVIEDEEIRRLEGAGAHLPLLSCRGVDFSYGDVQVLFDVDFTVEDGEMVALLGVNGAGKSTLLKVIMGLGLPTRGSVRLSGREITYMDAERRTRLGITDVPGGRGVFPQLSVLDNLRAYGYSLDRRNGAVEQAIERSFDAFPRLAERRDQSAATLSGGEQQMLALSKALILRPRILLIDELSLGLAPVIVEQLLDMVRQINADGTAIVLVEQSVNIALALVDHAYFMERGQIQFDGAADDLLQRSDLLRAVFLDGVAAAGPKGGDE